jgi:hypothetical protein
MYPLLVPLGLLVAGAVLLGAALLLLGEYRRIFFADPHSLMTMEVLFNILRLGGPGYLAVIAFIAGFLLFLYGTFFTLVFVWISARPYIEALLKTLNLGDG